MRTRHKVLLALVVAAAGALAGCSAPTATLDLITVARKGISMAKQGEVEQHAEVVKALATQLASLDTAFDADVRLVAAGQVADTQGKPLGLTAEWVISARRGYTTARDMLTGQVQATEASHTTRLDNLKAADEALDMASQLIVQQWAVTNRVRQELINIQRSLSHGR